MPELCFQLSRDRLNILETKKLSDGSFDFFAFGELKELSQFSDILEYKTSNGFTDITLRDSFIAESMRNFSNQEFEPEDFWTEYAKIRLHSIKNEYEYDFLGDDVARTIALNAIPRIIERGEARLLFQNAMKKTTVAKLFHEYEKKRTSDAMLDSRLIDFIRRYLA